MSRPVPLSPKRRSMKNGGLAVVAQAHTITLVSLVITSGDQITRSLHQLGQ